MPVKDIDIRLGRLASFPEIAERESQGERHLRLLAPLAFVSPRIIAAIAGGTAPAELTVTGLAKALPYSWAEQEQVQPLSRRGDGIVHSFAQLHLQRPMLCHYPFLDRLAPDDERPVLFRSRAEMREAEEAEDFGLPLPSLCVP